MKRFNSRQIGKSVQIFQRKKGGNWYASYRCELRQIINSLGTPNLIMATKLAEDMDKDLNIGSYIDIEMPESLEEGVNLFLDYLKSKGNGQSSLKKYNLTFKSFLEFCESKKVIQFKQLDQGLIELYRMYRNKNISEITSFVESKCLAVFGKYLVWNKIIKENVFFLEGINKPMAKSLSWFTQESIENILSSANDNEKPLFELLAFTGLRLSEAKRLTWSDIDFNSGLIHVKSAKDGKSRTALMPFRVKTTLRKMKVDSGLVFHSIKSNKDLNADEPLSEKSVIKNLNRICLKLGIKGSVHSFRKFFYSI